MQKQKVNFPYFIIIDLDGLIEKKIKDEKNLRKQDSWLIDQKGTDTGVSYNTPKEIHTNDKPINTIDVCLNLFFDGTMNNKTNTELGVTREKKKGSYANDYSNVARGYDAIASSSCFANFSSGASKPSGR